MTQVYETAILKNAVVVIRYKSDGSSAEYLQGNIYADARRRFEDGTFVTTSRIEEYSGDNIVRTKNTTYAVEWK